MQYQCLSIIGLVLDFIGVVILFFSGGLPPNLEMFDMYVEMKVKPEWEIKNRKIKNRSLWALFLIGIGFLFQIYGTFISIGK